MFRRLSAEVGPKNVPNGPGPYINQRKSAREIDSKAPRKRAAWACHNKLLLTTGWYKRARSDQQAGLH